MTTGVITASAATMFGPYKVQGTASRTIMNKAMTITTAYVLVVDDFYFNSGSGNLDYELFAANYSEVKMGTKGTFRYYPNSSKSKTYYLTAQCQKLNSEAMVAGTYDYS